jgi:hypothetical protein
MILDFKKYSLVFVILFCFVFVIKTYNSYKKSDNVSNLYIKILNPNKDSVSVQGLTFLSKKSIFVNRGENVFCIKNDGVILLKEVNLVTSAHLDSLTVLYALSRKPYLPNYQLNFIAATVKQKSEGASSIVVPKKNSLIRNYDKTINWGGDINFVFIPFIESLILSLVLVFFIILFTKRNYIKVNYKLHAQDRFVIILLFLLGLLFLILNNRNNSFPIIWIRQFDENIVSLLFEFFNNGQSFVNTIYGSFYNVLLMIFALPGLITGNYAWAITGGRMLSAVSALSAVFIIYKFLKPHLNIYNVILVVLFLISIPAFWINGTLLHPDWPMTAVFLLSLLFFYKSEAEFNSYYLLSVILFSISLAIKFQNILFLPIYGLPFFKIWKKNNLKAIGILVFVILSGFFLFDFKLLFKGAFFDWLGAMKDQSVSNKTGFDPSGQSTITLADKLYVISQTYLPYILFFIMFITTPLFLVYKKFQNKFEVSVVLTLYVVLFYYLLLVNKSWSYYYLTPIFLLVMIWFYFIAKVIQSQKVITIILSALLVVNIFAFNQFFLISLPSDYYLPNKDIVKLQLRTNDYLMNNLPEKENNIFLDYNVSFDFQNCNNIGKLQVFDYSLKKHLLNGNFGWVDDFEFFILSKKNLSRYETHRILEKELIHKDYQIFFTNEVCTVYRN